jgi:hypothetical protein
MMRKLTIATARALVTRLTSVPGETFYKVGCQSENGKHPFQTIVRLKRILASATLVCALLAIQTRASAQAPPACTFGSSCGADCGGGLAVCPNQNNTACENTAQFPSCVMSEVGTGSAKDVKTSNPVNIYFIWYGNWKGLSSSQIDFWTPGLATALINALNDSAYEATASTYAGPSGSVSGHLANGGSWFDTASQGTTLTDASVQEEISQPYRWDAGQATLPIDPNGIYAFMPAANVTFNSGTGVLCGNGPNGYNSSYPSPYGVSLNYIVIGDPTGNTQCQWNRLTPNTGNGIDTVGKFDGVMSTIAHEINESMTDPLGASGGWHVSYGTNTTQMADFCEWNFGPKFYTVNTGFGTGIGNFHGGNGIDFLLQSLRANENGGYCTNNYGGVFWQQNFGWTWSETSPADWSPGNYKGECEPGQPLVGLSEYASGNEQAHAVLCGSTANDSGAASQSALFPQSSCVLVPFNGLDGVDMTEGPDGFWDYSNPSAECPQTTEFVAGLSQSQSGVLNGILCCPSNIQRHGTCSIETFNSALPKPQTDWDWGYYKATCPNSTTGEPSHVLGVSALPSGSPHTILCCD